MGKKNPIAQRLDTLSDQWAEFAIDEEARLLCWLFELDELRMADAFLAAQADERAGTHPDVFITFETPFENPHGHGYTLYETLVAGYTASREALREQGVNADWQPAAFTQRPHQDVQFLVQRCESFIAHHRLSRHLVLVLRPTAVADPAAYRQWLQRFVGAAPANLRVLVFDLAQAPVFGALLTAEPHRARAQRAELDMSSALEEVSRDAGNLDTPGGQFRHLFVKLGMALKRQDLPLAMQLGSAALGIATAQGWWHVAVPVHFALAAGLTGAQRIQEALAQYAAAEAAAARGETEGPEDARPACKGMRLQARLGCGSALIAGGAWSMAAKLYEDTAPLAAESGDQRVLLDCHRLASFSYEQSGDPDRAFRAGMEGMNVARAMDEETLSTSTFPYLAEGLMRLTTKAPSLRGMDMQIEREIVGIAGTRDWRPKAPRAPAGPAASHS
jgi:hypothetical protein